MLEKRESRSHQNVGIVTVKTTDYTQDGGLVIIFKHTITAYKITQPSWITRLPPEGGER